MLGRTHMSTGLFVSILSLQVEKPVHLQSWITEISHGQIVSVKHAALWIGLGVLGSIVPDLDEFHSIAARKVEAVARIVLILFFLGLVWQHGGVNLITVSVVMVGVTTLFGGENARKAAMLMAAIALILIASLNAKLGTGWSLGLMLIALWSAMTAFVSHRTFTHSLVGVLLIGVGLDLMLMPLHMVFLIYPFMMGYLVHMIEDAISGGIPVWWPLGPKGHKRLGIRLVKTGGMIDHAVGLMSLVATLFLAAQSLR